MKMSSEPFDLKSSCDKKYFGFLIKSRECGFNIKEYWSLVFCWIHSVLSRTSNLNNLRSDYPVCEWSESLSCPYLQKNRGCFSWIFVLTSHPLFFQMGSAEGIQHCQPLALPLTTLAFSLSSSLSSFPSTNFCTFLLNFVSK